MLARKLKDPTGHQTRTLPNNKTACKCPTSRNQTAMQQNMLLAKSTRKKIPKKLLNYSVCEKSVH